MYCSVLKKIENIITKYSNMELNQFLPRSIMKQIQEKHFYSNDILKRVICQGIHCLKEICFFLLLSHIDL